MLAGACGGRIRNLIDPCSAQGLQAPHSPDTKTAKGLSATLGTLAALGESNSFEKATMGFEPMMRVLQTLALPLGDVARPRNKTPIACVGNSKPVAIGERAGDGIRTHDLLLGKETFYH